MTDLRDRIAAALQTVQGDITFEALADAVIAELGLREEWATQTSLLLGIVKLTRPDDAIAHRIGSTWKDIQ